MRIQFIALGVALLVALAVATAVHASPAPEEAESDCGWADSGITMIIGGVEFTCKCAMLTGPAGKRVICRWYRVDKLPQEKKKKPKPKPKPAPKKKPPKKAGLTIRVYPKPAVTA